MGPSQKRFDSMIVQDRDLGLLKGLFESRVMTAEHISVLYFDGRKEAAKKRLQKLKAAGLVGERARRSFEPAVLFLTLKSLVLLRERGTLTEYPAFALPVLDKRARVSDLTLRHELEVMDVKAAFHEAIKRTETFSIAEFGTWPRLYEFEASRSEINGMPVLVKPDGFTRIHEKEPDAGLSEHLLAQHPERIAFLCPSHVQHQRAPAAVLCSLAQPDLKRTHLLRVYPGAQSKAGAVPSVLLTSRMDTRRTANVCSAQRTGLPGALLF